MIEYATTTEGVTPGMLHGFFSRWKAPRTPDDHLRILLGSDRVVLAIDTGASRVVGFITAITDGVQAAFIPLLEVLPDYRKQGIGSELVKRMLSDLADIPCIDLTCDPEVQGFYERLGMVRSVGMVVRNY